LLCLLLAAITLGIFWQTATHEFINFDDDLYVTENYYVKMGLTRESISWAFTTFHAANWHPLTWLSHMADIELYGLNPKGHHLTNVFLHTANALLLFSLLAKITGSLSRSFLVANLFALHPLHVESVAWIAERKDVLSAFFWMLTLLLYAWYVKRPSLARYLLTLLAFAVGLTTKPMLVTLPFVLLLFDYWPLRHFMPCQQKIFSVESDIVSFNSPMQSFPILALVKEKIPFFILSVASSVITLHAQKAGGALANLDNVSFPYRLANGVVAYVIYLGKMVWPKQLALIYPLPSTIPAWLILGAALLLVIISFFVVRTRRENPYLFVGWFWYLGTLLPVIGIIQVGSQAMADRYTYIPLVGPFIMVVWGGHKQLRGWWWRNTVLTTSGALFITLLGFVTWRQLGYWKSSFTVFEHALDVTDNNKIAYVNLGVALSKAGKTEEASRHYTNGLQNSFYAADAHINLGILLAAQGKYTAAIQHYRQALQIRRDDAEVWYNLGLALASQGKSDEAIAHFREALRLNPNDADTHNNLGVLLTEKRNFKAAIAHYSEALRIRPEFEQARDNLHQTRQKLLKVLVRENDR
jgi:lipoprotein NlpI